jgi:hypothetical protein
VGAVLGSAALIAIAGIAMTGSMLSRVHAIECERGGTLTVVSRARRTSIPPASRVTITIRAGVLLIVAMVEGSLRKRSTPASTRRPRVVL